MSLCSRSLDKGGVTHLRCSAADVGHNEWPGRKDMHVTSDQHHWAEVAPVVFIIDDDESVRRSISRLLRAVGLNSQTFGSAEAFLEVERYQGVGCIVLDVRMPGLTGPDLQELLARADYPMPIVFITGHGTIPVGIAAMKKGAIDFLPKPFDDEELLEAVAKAIDKHREIKRVEAEKIGIHDRMKLLTPREDEIFRHVIAGMLNKQIAYKLGIAEKTVKVHRGHITEKLGISSVAELARLAERGGVELPRIGGPGSSGERRTTDPDSDGSAM
jgi:FixJ family two-component response regulator